jgi:hypothetical protein
MNEDKFVKAPFNPEEQVLPDSTDPRSFLTACPPPPPHTCVLVACGAVPPWLQASNILIYGLPFLCFAFFARLDVTNKLFHDGMG